MPRVTLLQRAHLQELVAVRRDGHGQADALSQLDGLHGLDVLAHLGWGDEGLVGGLIYNSEPALSVRGQLLQLILPSTTVL